MGLGDYWIKSNDGKVLNLFNIKEVKKGDVENNPSFFKLFNIFDTKHTDGSSGADGILDREELLSLFFSVAETARNSGHSVFEKELADKYVNQTKLSNGKTLKELNVNSDEFIDFLSMIVDDSESESSLNNLTPEQKNKFEEIKKVQGYYNLSSIQKKFILEAIKNNVHVDSIVEVVKNSPENNFNEKTFKMFQKALSDTDLNVKTFGTGLALSLLSDEQYSTAKELYLKQNREDNIDLKVVAQITQFSKPFDKENLSHYVFDKIGPHKVHFDEYTIEYLIKMEEADRDKFFSIIKDTNISPKYYSRIAKLIPIYDHLPKNLLTKFPDFIVVPNNIEGTIGFSPSQDSNVKYYYSKEHGLYEIRKTDNNTEIVVNKKTNTIDRVVYKNLPGYTKIVESETIEKYDYINMTDVENYSAGNLVKKTVRKLSDVEGVYNTSEIDSRGKQKPLEFGSKDNDGNVYVEKNYTSPEGVKTQYSFERTVDNKVIIDYKITGINKKTKKQEVLLDRHQTVEHKGNGLVVTSINGKVYEAKFDDKKLVIIDKTNNVKREFYLGKVFIDDGINIIMNILQNVPANELMVMKKLPISAIYYNRISNVRTDNNARWSEVGKFIEMGHEARLSNLNMIRHSNDILSIMLPTFLHEFGHYLDSDAVSGLCCTMSKNPILMEIFKAELKEFISSSNGLQQEYIAYFIDSIATSADRNSQERVAEANTILNTLPSQQYANRASYLQQYFPRTIAKIAELMEEVLA